MLKPWPHNTGMPRIVQPIQHVNRLLHQKVLLIWTVEFKHIKANRVFHIGGVEIDNIFHSLFRHLPHERLDQITVRINQRKPSAIHHVLIRHIFLQYRLTNTSLTDDVNVATAILRTDTNWLFRTTKFIVTNQ